MNRLRATLAIETLEQLPLPVASSVSKAGDRRNEFDEAKREKEFARMMRRKLAKHARAMHLPLFRQGSALFQRFGEKTLSDYDKLPKIQFDGPIAVIHSNEEEQEHAEYLWKQKVVGVDTEARPDFQPLKGSKGNPVCLIQISTLERAFLYRLQRGKPLPPILHDLFADSNVLKVGHSLSDDFRQLKLSNLVQAVNSTIDTLYITHKLGCLRPGLKTACQVMLGGSLDKDLQVSDWEAPSLSDAQIIYAATDAWAPLRVLLAAIQFKETLQLLRTISYSSSARAVVDENHDVILGKLLAFSLRHQIPTID
ncbi:3-5 exonuclease [Plasmopara halstedii]|uniref:3-5 exonuclease n=1 Tax=Plasmopara halstedii TaxID=4781 RepID=A0A0N7L6M8_PLAHL|nr:3-5 exonuclease [Plasmopara halstedii]CEG44715.1 3-5 exonuclease [Plasmopara halstedii]|eukprot:XP_024581084.1 3-5 exonuclease [Plasmopara halstedii]